MENIKTKFVHSLTFKGMIIASLTLLLLIPSVMIQGLIEEREIRNDETVLKINDKWSKAQTVCAPLLVIPYTKTWQGDDKKNAYIKEHKLYITPKNLKINTKLLPEKRHYGIYKAILYKSDINLSGDFADISNLKIENSILHFDRSYIIIGVSDLRGITQNVYFKLNSTQMEATIGEGTSFEEEIEDQAAIDYGNWIATLDKIAGKTLTIPLKGIRKDNLQFTCNLKLNGSSYIKFIPIGQTTNVQISGAWQSPSFVGIFTPEYTIDNKQFEANWNILNFNRDIPDRWTDNDVTLLSNNAFGVNLIETADHYQQNMRSAKYAIIFILLTFVVFFFVEALTKKQIHFVQYLLVGFALILFYSLLLSISEQLGFGLAYLISSASTISLIGVYTYSVLKKYIPVTILVSVLTMLYLFLYIILQIEDLALLIGSLFLFIILGIIMFVSNKVKWNKD
ncbi:MAG: cell envelope integrity protein CreD [Bacteroidales bacterium]|jgi:inner membrane protein|nr:cell envelope integrity protein CreD [Bacteroidales bacterium]